MTESQNDQSQPRLGRAAIADLTPTEQTILELERQRWKYAGAKDAAIMDRLGWTRTRYDQVLLALLDRPDVEAAAPLLVRRLRRLRDARREQRCGRRAVAAVV